jgi:alpha-galactosidase
MRELCPGAWHLLVSNPVLAATTLLQRKYPDVRMVGLCHGFAAAHGIPDALGLGAGNLTYEIPGVNHFVWLRHCYHAGRDVFPLLDQWLANEAKAHWERSGQQALVGPMSPKSTDLYRQLGVVPIGDTANWTGASWPWWYHSDADVEKQWRVESEAPWFQYIDHIRSTPDRHKRMAEDPSKKVTDQLKLGDKLTGEPMIPVVESVSKDVPRVVIVNTLNRHEYVEGVPRDFEVEIPALVSRRGIQGIHTTPLPKAVIAHILRDRVAPVEMELAAYEQGSRALLTQLVLMDKWTQSARHAGDLIDAIFALPYHRELREHYR